MKTILVILKGIIICGMKKKIKRVRCIIRLNQSFQIRMQWETLYIITDKMAEGVFKKKHKSRFNHLVLKAVVH